MKTIRVLRYVCDFCHKGRSSKRATQEHETRCIFNPKRICPICTEREWTTPDINRLTEALNDGGLEALRKAAEGCPSCILSAIVQDRAEGMKDPYWDWRTNAPQYVFDYKTELAKFEGREDQPEIEF